MMRDEKGTTLRRIEFLLLLAGALCAGFVGVASLRSVAAARAPFSGSEQVMPAGEAVRTIKVDPNPTAAKASVVMGRLEIRQLELSVPILSDYQSASLLKGIGHIPGTAMPGGLGTIGLAGHRDTYFRPLRGIRKNMDIRVANDEGVYHYVVDSTEIVKPDQVEVLDIRSRPELALITCYPFSYIGAAPMRFIVHAHLLSALPDPN